MKTNATENPTGLPDLQGLWDFRNPKETESRFRELLPRAEASGDQDYHAELLTQLARTQGLQMKFDDAHAILDSAEQMISEEMIVPRIRYYLERGRAFNSSGRKEEASALFLQAFNLASEHNEDFYAVDAAHMLGISEKPEQALDWNMKAIEFAEQSDDKRTKGWLGPLYNNTGWTLHDMGQYEKAMDLFERSLTWRQERKDARGTFIAKWTIGRTFRSMNRLEEALEQQRELLHTIDAGEAEKDGYVYEELGECLLAQGNHDEAKPYFAQASALLSQDPWLQKNEPQRLERLQTLGS